MSTVIFPYAYIPDPTKGKPISNGQLFFGLPDLDPEIEANRITVGLQQEDGTIVNIAPASQPILTGAGGVPLYNGSPAIIVLDSSVAEYSLKILDKNNSQVYYNENASALVNSDEVKDIAGLFDNLAEAVAHDGFVGDFVQTYEYNAGTALGGAKYEVVAGGTGTSDGVLYIDMANGNQLKLIADGALNVYQSGALPDVADQQTKIQAIVDAAVTLGAELDWSCPEDSEWLTSYPIVPKSNSSWIGKGTLRNNNPAGDVQSSTLHIGGFNPVYFDPANPSVIGYSYFNLNAVGQESEVTLTNAGDASNFSQGDLVWIVSDSSYEGNAGNYPLFAQLAVVEGTNGAVLSLDRSIAEDINADYGAAKIALAEQDTVLDILGNPMRFCRNAKIDGGLSLISDTASCMQRGGMDQCQLNFDTLKAKNVVFINAVCATNISVNTILCTRKAVDIAGSSQNFDIDINNCFFAFDAAVSEDVSYARIGEGSRDGVVKINNLQMEGFSFPLPVLQIDSGSHRAGFDVNQVNAPDKTDVAFRFQSSVVPSGDQNSVLDCWMDIKNSQLSPNMVRGAFFNDTAGASFMKRCGFKSLNINSGSFSLYGAEMGGEDSYINSANVVNGSLRAGTSVIDTFIRGYFGGGVSIVERQNDVLISSNAFNDALVGDSVTTNVVNISDTTSGNSVESFTFPANSLAGGDRFLITGKGEILNTNGDKFIRFTDDNTTFFTFTIPSTFADTFEVVIELIVQNNTRYTAFGYLNQNGIISLLDSIDTSADLSQANTFDFQSWVANASDIVRFHKIDTMIKKPYHGVR